MWATPLDGIIFVTFSDVGLVLSEGDWFEVFTGDDDFREESSDDFCTPKPEDFVLTLFLLFSTFFSIFFFFRLGTVAWSFSSVTDIEDVVRIVPRSKSISTRRCNSRNCFASIIRIVCKRLKFTTFCCKIKNILQLLKNNLI